MEEINLNREQFDQAMARVSGELIINLIEKEIINIYNQEAVQQNLIKAEKEAEEFRIQNELKELNKQKLLQIQIQMEKENLERQKLELESINQN